MSEEQYPWAQQEGEPDLWYGRFNRFRLMGTRRSVNAVFRREFQRTARIRENQRGLEAGGDWYDTAKRWNWEQRARAYDEYQRAKEDQIIAEERERVLRSGFALMHKRIKELDRLTRKLIKMTNDEAKVWLQETRTFGTDEESTTVEKVEFNAPLFTLIDKYLGSIAAEMGERVKKTEVTGKDGAPQEFVIDWGGGTLEEKDG
jgi:hypothetical protein